MEIYPPRWRNWLKHQPPVRLQTVGSCVDSKVMDNRATLSSPSRTRCLWLPHLLLHVDTARRVATIKRNYTNWAAGDTALLILPWRHGVL